MKKIEIPIGSKFGYWTTIDERSNTHVECRCKCGFISNVQVGRLFSKKIRGCRSCTVTKHGLSGSKEYGSWTAMVDRCTNEDHLSFHLYGGRGITVCEEWLDFECFYRDMGQRLQGMTLDRIDTSKGYYKENCRWADWITQANNTRKNIYAIYEDKKYTVAILARKIGMPYSRLYGQLQRGTPIKRSDGTIFNVEFVG